MSEFRDKASEIQQLGASIFGISVESDRAHRAFAAQLGLPFPLLSDFNREVVARYGIQYEQEYSGFRGMSKRAVFVIDEDGIIRYKWVTEDASRAPDVQQVIDCLRELRRRRSLPERS